MRFKNSLLLALVFTVCLPLMACQQGPAAKGTKPAAGAGKLSTPAYFQRRCAQSAGPAAAKLLWHYQPGEFSLEALSLNPGGGFVDWESNQHDFLKAKLSGGNVEPHNEMVSVDAQGQADWHYTLPREGQQLIGDQYFFSEFSAKGGYLYLVSNRYADVMLRGQAQAAPAGRVSIFKVQPGKGLLNNSELTQSFCMGAPLLAADGGLIFFTQSMIETIANEDPDARRARAGAEMDTKHNTLYAYDPSLKAAWTSIEQHDAGALWARELMRYSGSFLACDAGNQVFIVRDGVRLLALAKDGAERWRYEQPTPLYPSPLLRADGTVIVTVFGAPPPSEDVPRTDPQFASQLEAYRACPRTLTCLDKKGQALWSYPTATTAGYSQAAADDGSVYLLSSVADGEFDFQGQKLRQLRVQLVKLDPQGKEAFSYDTGVKVNDVGPASLGQLYIDNAGNVYWAAGKTLLSLDSSGKLRFTLELEKDVQFQQRGTGLALNDDGKLYLWQADGVSCYGDE